MKRRRSAALLSALAVGGALLVPAAAWAAPTTHVVQGDVLRLVSVADWDAASSLLPEEPVQWDVAVSADAPDPGVVRIAVSASGDAALVVDVSLCLAEWTATGCPGGATELRTAWSIPLDGVEIPLTEISDTQAGHLRLAIALAGDDALGSTQVRVHAAGAGESAVVGPDGGLATTGLSSAVPWILAAGAALLAIGGVLLMGRRGRERDEGSGS
jgi:LPXTG-motif cell wall-anchored protein